MTVTTKVDFKDYLKLAYILTYRKPTMIWISFVGLVMLFFAISYFLNVWKIGDPPYFQLAMGIVFVFLLPFSVYWQAKKNFTSTTRIGEEIKYEFLEDTMKTTGETFTSELTWNKVFKVEEMKDCFLVYHNNLVFNIIPKKYFADDEIKNFRNTVRKFPNLKKKLKK